MYLMYIRLEFVIKFLGELDGEFGLEVSIEGGDFFRLLGFRFF